MKNKYLKLLGVKVMPIVKRNQYNASNWDRTGNLPYLNGEERNKYSTRVVDDATKEQRRINKTQKWGVYSVHADGNFTLRSDMGYEQGNVSRSDFRVLDYNVNIWG